MVSTSCSSIDDDLDDCFIDLKAEYELRLVTNENFELARTLSDRPGIADALRRLLTESPAARADRIRRGLDRAAVFSWPAHAKAMVHLLQTVPETAP